MHADVRLMSPMPVSPQRPLTPEADPVAVGMQHMDHVADALGVQGLFQDTSRVASMAGRGASGAARVADDAARVGQLTSAMGKGLQVVGKAGTILSVPFAYYDVAKAVMEKDLTKRRAAWANAGLTLGGAAMGVASLTAKARVGVPLLVGSAALGALQLADTFLLKGRVAQWLGDRTAEQWARIRP